MTKLAYIPETVAFLRFTVNKVDSKKYSWDIGEPITEKFTVEDFVHTIFVLSNYVHDEGWNTDGTKAQGKFTLKKG